MKKKWHLYYVILIGLMLIGVLTEIAVIQSYETGYGPDRPEDVTITVVSEPLNPLHDIREYLIYLTAVDSLPAGTEESKFIEMNSGGIIKMNFIAPTRYVEFPIDTVIFNKIYIVANEKVGYTKEETRWRAQLMFDVDAEPGLYDVRVKGVSVRGKHGRSSEAGVNFVRVQ